MDLWEYNLLLLIKRRWAPIAAVLLLFAIGFGYAYHVTPGTQTFQSTTSEVLYHWSGGVGGRGIVTEPNPIWNIGERVELPIYPLSIMPSAEIELAFNVSGKNVKLRFERELKVVYYISYDKERVIEEVYRSTFNVSTGSSFADKIVLNVSDVFGKIEMSRGILKLPREQTGVEIIGAVRYSGTVDGKPVNGVQSFKGTLSFPYEGFYTISGESKNGTQTFSKTVTRVRAVNGGRRAFLISMSLLCGALAVFAVVIGRKFDPSKYDPEELALAREKKKLSKWISRGKLPENLSLEGIQLLSLTDLIEAAIDTNRRVIHDPERGVYFFLNEGVLYYFLERTAEGDK